MELGPEPEAPATIDPSVCKQHPARAAVATCPKCATPVCTTCSFDVYGTAYCGDCAIAEANAVNAARPARGDFSASGGILNLSGAAQAAPREREGLGKCLQHPEVDGVASCKLCWKAACATCDFSFPGDVHLCPLCVETQSSADVSPRRRKLSNWALVCAVWSTIFFVLLLSGAFASYFTDPDTARIADLVVTNAILWPLLAGTGLSLSALDPKLRSTGLMKAAAWWNCVVGGLFYLLILAGNLGIIK